MLLKVRDEYDRGKEDLYSSLFANYCFEHDLTDEDANYILLLLEKITYRQLLILSYLSKNDIIHSERWEVDFSQIKELARYYGLFAESENLFSLKLVGPTKSPHGIKLGLPDITLSPLGTKMVKLLGLSRLETNEIERDIEVVEAIVNRTKRST